MTSPIIDRKAEADTKPEAGSSKYQEKWPPASPKKQRPIQTVMRRKPIQKVDQPVKAEPKASSHDNKVVIAEVKKQEEKKKSAPQPALDKRLSGHYELSARMNQMVETELRDIMIKVWHELPDNPTDEVESLVVDKLRSKAGDDLRNVLGLNITKRLLNIHNPLYVKVQFSGKPEKVHLGEFLKKYNFNAFKRMEKTVNMFAAQVRTIGDFDRICSTKDIRCGDIKVTVNPIYKFTKCPPNLVTSFNNQDDFARDEAIEVGERSGVEETPEKSNTSEKVAIKQNVNVPPKPKVESNVSGNVAKVVKVVTQHKLENKIVTNSTVESKPAVNKPEVENKAAANKPAVDNKVVNKTAVEKKDVVNEAAVENKAVVNKPAVGIKAVINKPAVENKTVVNKPAAEKEAVVNKAVDNKPAVENKAVVNKPAKTFSKPAVDNKITGNIPVVDKPAIENKTTVNKTSEECREVKKAPINAKTTPNNTAKKALALLAKTPTKTHVKATPQAKDNTKKTNKVENDYDELDDHDILALISDGIVLDECSGSDDD